MDVEDPEPAEPDVLGNRDGDRRCAGEDDAKRHTLLNDPSVLSGPGRTRHAVGHLGTVGRPEEVTEVVALVRFGSRDRHLAGTAVEVVGLIARLRDDRGDERCRIVGGVRRDRTAPDERHSAHEERPPLVTPFHRAHGFTPQQTLSQLVTLTRPTSVSTSKGTNLRSATLGPGPPRVQVLVTSVATSVDCAHDRLEKLPDVLLASVGQDGHREPAPMVVGEHRSR